MTAIGFSVSSETSLGTAGGFSAAGAACRGGQSWCSRSPPGCGPQVCSITCTLRPLPWTPNSESPAAHLRASQVNFSGSRQKSPSAHRILEDTLSGPCTQTQNHLASKLFCSPCHFPKAPSLNRNYLYAWPLTTFKGHKSSFTEDKNKKLPQRQILSTLQFCFK